MTVVTKMRIVITFTTLLPLAVIMLWADPTLFRDKGFDRILALGVVTALLIGLLGPNLFMHWLIVRALEQIHNFCERVKRGDYTGFTVLPNEAADRDSENEFVALMRDMNWMAHQIKVRERQLENTIAELHTTKSELLVQKQTLAETNVRLMEMAMTDPLTGVSNRRHFFDHLEQEICRNRRGGGSLSLLILDIDYFKRINDQHGHQSGDRVLLELAAVLQQSIAKSDLAARIGGEEFAVLLSDAGYAEAMQIARNIHRAIQNHRFYNCSGEGLQVTCSIGLCSVDYVKFVEAHVLYRLADDALYTAKNEGRNCIRHGVYQHEDYLKNRRSARTKGD